ncbi:hypothetical protein [Tessaracoccus antarcticus]|uniref:Uncharacterized protein n=1 Tax=Tessaracoccus antarcticus TaxID=2479848 RepID=A0A3M0G6B8_9ACTN|nr:hypothetical protein [Tessaracoccus antarcticus]RMB57842.1 hypothetical protein EAX62_15420 [Tessaracoccus antarcticus]
MAVQHKLGIAELVVEADATWPAWSAPEPAVARFGSVGEVEWWRHTATHDEIEEFFRALGRLTCTEASHRAAAVMVQLLVPGVKALTSRRCTGEVPRADVESVVAGYVWTVILGYPWDAPTDAWIPAAILRTVGRAVDREFGWGDRGEGAWRSRTYLGSDTLDRMVTDSRSDQPLQASGVYWWAVSTGLVSAADLDLLLQLAVIATDEGAPSRSSAGITSRSACAQVAAGRGLTVDQVQHRARQALGSLRATTGTNIAR